MTAFALPTVAVLSTGNEVGEDRTLSSCLCTFSLFVLAVWQLDEPGTASQLAPGKVYDSNRHTILAALSQHHCKGVDLGIVKDT